MREVYYNECNTHAAEWLRALMADGLIPKGVIDEQPIQLVQPGDLSGFVQCHFFAGIGGWARALRLVGFPDDQPVWTGSCPCQSFSTAGARRGFEDKDKHLWPQFFSLIAEYRPPLIFGEQVDNAIKIVGDDSQAWVDVVSTDLGSAGYSFGAAVLPALYVGAPHKRNRIYFVADSDGLVWSPENRSCGARVVAPFWSDAKWELCPDGKRRAAKPGVRTVVDGLPGGMDVLRGAGNAIVPQQAGEFIEAYLEARMMMEGRVLDEF